MACDGDNFTLILGFIHLCYLNYLNVGLTPSGTHNPNSSGSDACRGGTDFGLNNRQIQERASLKSVFSGMSGPLPETILDRTQANECRPEQTDAQGRASLNVW